MPLYTYKCNKCKKTFDTISSIYDDDPNKGVKCFVLECDGVLEKQVATGQTFSIKGNYTARNNYGLKGREK